MSDQTTRENSRQKKYVLLNFKISEKIKQVSSTKLTNWYKNISLWKTNKFFHRLIFLDAKLKVSKILLQSLRASFRKSKNYFVWKKKLTKSKNRDLTFLSSKRDLVFLRHLVKESPNPGLRLCSKKTQSPKRDFRVYMKYLKVNKWFCLTHYHLISYWNNYYEHTCTSNQLLDSLQVKLKPMTVL